MATLNWRDTAALLATDPDSALERAFETFRRDFRSICTSEHPSYGTLTIWVPADREAGALARLHHKDSGGHCAVGA
jgi:hypothetical protein